MTDEDDHVFIPLVLVLLLVLSEPVLCSPLLELRGDKFSAR